MDPRRLLSLAAAGAALTGCAVLRPDMPEPELEALAVPAVAVEAAPTPVVATPPRSPTERPYMEVIQAGRAGSPPFPPSGRHSERAEQAFDPALDAELFPSTPASVPRTPPETGRTAIAAANAEARAASRADAFVGGVQVFAYDPGRVYEVWAAPLRVTTLTLAPGETVTSKAAGDTVRWQIGEASSGEGPGRRTHVLLKPLERGLETNLVLTTSQRVYFLQLRSGSPDGFNAAVAWDLGAVLPPEGDGAPDLALRAESDPPPSAQVPDARYRISPRGRAPRWTPTAVFNDGVRTFVAFSPDLKVDEAPALFLIAPDGEAQMVNYRQQGGLFIVDRLFDRAELRLGDSRPQVVRIERLAPAQGGRP